MGWKRMGSQHPNRVGGPVGQAAGHLAQNHLWNGDDGFADLLSLVLD